MPYGQRNVTALGLTLIVALSAPGCFRSRAVVPPPLSAAEYRDRLSCVDATGRNAGYAVMKDSKGVILSRVLRDHNGLELGERIVVMARQDSVNGTTLDRSIAWYTPLVTAGVYDYRRNTPLTGAVSPATRRLRDEVLGSCFRG